MPFEVQSTSLLSMWSKLSRIPGGKRLFSRFMGLVVPYSGRLGARIEELAPGSAKVILIDRRAVRNHLRSIHAMALANLGELATGLALNVTIPPTARAILTDFHIVYTKKARGTLRATCALGELTEKLSNTANITSNKEFRINGIIQDASSAEVARITATWMVGPRQQGKQQ